MSIKDHIHKFISTNDTLSETVQEINRNGDADEAILKHQGLLKDTNYNSQLGLSFASVLQFCSDPKLDMEFEREDILKLYKYLVNAQDTAINIYYDYSYFLDSVMYDKKAAQESIRTSISKLELQIQGLKKIVADE